jgi:hypothetical protein
LLLFILFQAQLLTAQSGPMTRAVPQPAWSPAALADRAHEEWTWLRLGGELRSRLEAPTRLSFIQENDDAYLLTRMRLNARVTARPWLKFFGESQDVRAFGKNGPVPATMANRLDLRQAYVELGATEESGWGLRLGRQGLKYGTGRLVWDPDWGNFGQVFDAIRFTLASRRTRVDLFASTVLVPSARSIDRSDPSRMLYGVYGSLRRWGTALQIEPYLFLKSDALCRNELGQTGALDLYTAGLRAFGIWARSVDWEIETAFQSGRLAGHPVNGFGGVWLAGIQTGARPWQPRISATYLYGSGDRNPKDGRKSTFDTLYPSVHMRNGATDRVGWANIRDICLQGDWKIARQWKVIAGGHDFHLVSVRDALYSPSGTPVVRNPQASSTHLGWELFVNADYQITRSVIFGAGCAHLFRGAFLRESNRTGVTQPYVFLTYRF